MQQNIPQHGDVGDVGIRFLYIYVFLAWHRYSQIQHNHLFILLSMPAFIKFLCIIKFLGDSTFTCRCNSKQFIPIRIQKLCLQAKCHWK